MAGVGVRFPVGPLSKLSFIYAVYFFLPRVILEPPTIIMREIEMKAKIKNGTEMIKKLEDLGCVFNNPILQNDTVFSNPSISFVEFLPDGQNLLRIREQNDEIIFTLKRPQANELDAIEREVRVDKRKELEDIIKFMGYEKAIVVRKTRRTARFRDYEICVDEVEELGSFIELERISDENAEKVQSEMIEFLHSLGIAKDDLVFRGYDTLLYIKKHQL